MPAVCEKTRRVSGPFGPRRPPFSREKKYESLRFVAMFLQERNVITVWDVRFPVTIP